MVRIKKTFKKVFSLVLTASLILSIFNTFDTTSYAATTTAPATPPAIEKQKLASMTVRGTDTGTQNQILGPQGGSGGFPFPVFNNYESQRQYTDAGTWIPLTNDTKYQGDFTMFDAIKDDLGIYFKITGDVTQYPQFANYVRINDPEVADYNLALSYFWEWGGGIHLNFPKNNGTTNLVATVKLASISNPNVKVEYNFTITPAVKLTAISAGSERLIRDVNNDRSAGVHFNNMAFNGGSTKYLQVADDIALFIKRKAPYKDYQGNVITTDETEWMSIDENPESGFIYGQDFGHYWNDGGGFYFTRVAQTFTFKMQSKSNPNVSVEFTFNYTAPNPNDKLTLPLSFWDGRSSFTADVNNGSVGLVTPRLGTRMVDLDEFDYFKKYIWAWDYEVVGSGDSAKVVRRDPSLPEVGPDAATVTSRNIMANVGKQYGTWKEIGSDMDSKWRYALAGYKPRDGKQFSLWFDGGVYGYWFQPVKYDTQMVFSRPQADGGFDKTGTPTTNSNTLVYNFTGNPKVIIPEAMILDDLKDSDWKQEPYWSDEFDGSALDTNTWSYSTGYYLNSDLGTWGWGNDEKEWYNNSQENIFLKDGKLNIVAKKEPRYDFTEFGQPSNPNQIAPYSSGKIWTKDKFSFTYGRIDFKAKAPKGNGLWPALWMMPQDSAYGTWAASGELDVFEGRGRVPSQSTGAAHFGGSWPNNTNIGAEYNYADYTEVPTFAAANNDPEINPTADFDNWHIYSLVWEKDKVMWYVDGKFYNVITKDEWWSSGDANSDTAPFDKPFYPIINLALGGWFDGNIPVDENSIFTNGVSNPLQVDYVRVYVPTDDTREPLAIDPESITLNKSQINLSNTMLSEKLTATITPTNGKKSVTWTTSNANVATVSADGTVNAEGSGTATITATTVNGLQATCTVTVIGVLKVPVSSIEFKASAYNLLYGSTLNVANEVVFNPTDATNKSLTFTVADSSILKIQNGVATPLANGSTTVTATSANGKTAACTVTVNDVPNPYVKISQATMNLTNATPVGKLAAAVVNNTETGVTWTSSNTSVATVVDGVVTATGNGTATITASPAKGSGTVATCTVVVTGYGEGTIAAQENVIAQTANSVTLGRASLLTAGLFVTSDMSKTTFAQVGYAGDMPVVNGIAQFTITKKPVMNGAGFTATPLAAGDTFKYWIRVYTSTGEKMEGPFTYIHQLSQEVVATGISIKPVAAVTMEVGSIYQLAADIAPVNVTNKEVVWTSSNTSVATVAGVKGGLVTAVSSGTATITVKTADGKFIASCVVTVGPPEDVNKDSIVSMLDLNEVATKYNTKITAANTSDKIYDINGDNIIDIFDIVSVSTQIK
jgi:uncharacterized protein YjdB